MRVGIDAHMLGDKSGGNETYYKNILLNMGKLIKDEEIILFMNKKNNVKYINDLRNMKKENFMISKASIRNSILLPLYPLKYDLDLFHIQYFGPLVKTCPIISTIHDISFEHYPEFYTKRELAIMKKWIPYTAKTSDIIFTVSEFSKKDIANRYEINPEKIKVTYNATGENFRVIEDKNSIRNIIDKFSIDGEYILTVGNLQPRKNIPRLVQAYIKLRETNTTFKYKLVIVGKKAWLFDDILRFIKESTFKDDIILTDYVTDEELVYLYNGAEFFVYPSVFEGFGLPILEAMACGTPVITSNANAMIEVSGDSALLFNPYDVDDIVYNMRVLAENRDLRLKMSESGLKRASEFSWNDTSRIVLDTYKEVIMNKKG